jgi:hypothetical protein
LGHLFRGRYKSLIVDGSGTGYLKTVCDYVHLNPDVRKARMAARLRAQTTMTWPWIAEQLAMGHWRTASNAARTVVLKRKR